MIGMEMCLQNFLFPPAGPRRPFELTKMDSLLHLLLLFPVLINALDCDSDGTSTAPQGIRLAFGSDPTTSMTVSFFTCASSSPDTYHPPLVHLFGPDGNHTYIGTTVGSVAEGRFQHFVPLNNLTHASTYHYTVALSGPTDPRSRPFVFHTASLSSSNFVVAVIGDMGVNGSSSTISWLERGQYNATLHLGDVAYADDYDAHLVPEPSSGRSYEAVYSRFLRVVENVSARAPYHVCPGNHDVTCHATTDHGCTNYQKNFSALNRNYQMPGYSLRGHNMWYSYDLGPVHFVSISTETDYPSAPTTPKTWLGGGAGGGFGDQIKWLEHDLAAAANKTSTRWIVVTGHRPWYSSSETDWPLLTPIHLRKAFEQMMYDYGVDMYVCGHKHFYERTKPAFDEKEDQARGIVHVTNGAAGNNEGVQKKGHGKAHGLIVAGQYAKAGTGFGELAVVSSNASEVGGAVLRWRYRLSRDGSVVDEMTLPPRDRRTKERRVLHVVADGVK